MDSANGFNAKLAAFAVCRNGTKLSFAYNDLAAADLQLYNKSFDMATDTWGSATSGGPLLAEVVGTGRPYLSIAARTTGELIVFFNSAKENVSGTNYDRVSYVRWSSGGGWSSATQVAGQSGVARHFYAARCIADSTDRIHLLFASTTAPPDQPTDRKFSHVALNSSNVERTVQDIAPQDLYSGGGGNLVADSIGIPTIFNDGVEKLGVAWAKSIFVGSGSPPSGGVYTQHIQVATAVVADNPSWSSEEAVAAGTPLNNSPGTQIREYGLVYYPSALHLVWSLTLRKPNFVQGESIICYTKKAASPLSWVMPRVAYIPEAPYTPVQTFAALVTGGIGILHVGTSKINSIYTERAQYYLLVPSASSGGTQGCVYLAY